MIDKLRGMLKSKTAYFALALSLFGMLADNLGVLQMFMSPKGFGLYTLFISGTVIVLRWVTTQALDEK